MIADLHAHYPMHLTPRGGRDVLRLVATQHGRWRLLDRVRAVLVGIASRFANYESYDSGPRVTVPLMRAGGYGVALSVLYSPFDEMDISLRYGSPPQSHYFATLMRQLRDVERALERDEAGAAALVRNPADLDAALSSDRLAIVHCVEGAFHLGATP